MTDSDKFRVANLFKSMEHPNPVVVVSLDGHNKYPRGSLALEAVAGDLELMNL